MPDRVLPPEMTCPRCGGHMDLGWLFTAEGPIRYQRLEPSMIERFFGGGERVGGSGFFGGSVRVEAMRCSLCNLGVFDGTPS